MTAEHARREDDALGPELRSAYRRLIEAHAGLCLSEHQADGLGKAITSLLSRAGYASPGDLYHALLAGTRHELRDLLAADLTVGETHFFRIGPQIQALQRVILPDLVARRASEQRLRIWSAGCSTGEEAYTVAILLREALPALEGWDTEILATDISHRALETARRAVYGAWSFRDTPAAVRERYFTAADKRWHLVDSVRCMVRFAQLNLASDGFPAPGPQGPDVDLILCRNVTIYFSPEAAQRLYRRFAATLAPGGWLVLGPSDPAPDPPGMLSPVYLSGAVLWRQSPATAAMPLPLPLPAPVRSALQPAQPCGLARPLAATTSTCAVSGRPGVGQVSIRTRRTSPSATTPHRPAAVPVAPATDPSTVLEKARALAHRGDREEARAHVEHLVRAWPLEMEGYLLLGMICLDEGAVDSAIDSLRRATFLDSSSALAHFTLGQAYLRGHDGARARAAFTHARRVLAGAPDDDIVHGGGDLLASELRYAVEMQLAGLSAARAS